MKKIITIALLLVSIIHLIPVSGVLGAERLTALYGLSFDESNLAILMQHRAVLFGLLGLFIGYAAFNRAYQPLAFIAGFISVFSFLLISWTSGNYNQAIQKVVIADWVALVFLVVAFVCYLLTNKS